ncbi:MAG: tetratricopeptide repeat protein [Polyangiaceae bacterium]
MTRARRVLICVAALMISSSTLVPLARADDAAADEAELHFQLGAEAYQKQDYRKALEHFLFSNRLAFNKKVTSNIGRCYERLGQFPEAFRFYTLALDNESDADARASLEREIQSLKPKVAVARIVTDPPGATLYVDRKISARVARAPGHSPSRAVRFASSPRCLATSRQHLSPSR